MKQPPTWRQTSRHPAICPPTRLHRPTHPWSQRPTRRLIRVPIHLSSHPPPHRPGGLSTSAPLSSPSTHPRQSHRLATLRPHPRGPVNDHPPNTRTSTASRQSHRPPACAPSYIPAACSHPRNTTPDHPARRPHRPTCCAPPAHHPTVANAGFPALTPGVRPLTTLSPPSLTGVGDRLIRGGGAQHG